MNDTTPPTQNTSPEPKRILIPAGIAKVLDEKDRQTLGRMSRKQRRERFRDIRNLLNKQHRGKP